MTTRALRVANTPFGTKGVAVQRRGDAVIGSKSHPPQSPFLRKGEESVPCESRGDCA